ncbi:MFS transporter, partial [Bordetella pertussis]
MSEPRPRRILPIIVLAQFCGTSLWFAGNAASADLGMGDSVAYVASAVQLGFIVGTLCSAWLRIADRYAASRLFFGSCLLGAACNYPLTMLALATLPQPDAAVLILRFLVGVALAGIYPVGIRAAASWFQAGLGHALGFLTGALVLGTSFPHLMRALGARIDGGLVLASASAIAVLGGAAMLAWVPDGPYARRAPSSGGGTLAQAWRSLPGLRAAAIGY